jgi:hypothetical protein
MPRTRWPQHALAGIRDLLGYGAILTDRIGSPAATDAERDLNRKLSGYPRNHNYRVAGGRMLPSFRLYQRLRRVAPLYPEPLESLLDVGCCRGYFVLDAARRPPCRVAVGIDVYEPFVSAARQAKETLNVERCEFHLATLDDVAGEPESFGGPFQTVLLLNTYHYLFWGSQLSPRAYFDHRAILSRLAAVASDRILFTARLEIDRLPRPLREEARVSRKSVDYTASRFFAAAEELFDVRQAGAIGKDALLVMSKRRK